MRDYGHVALPAVQTALAAGGLDAAPRSVVEPLVAALVRSWRPDGGRSETSRTSAAARAAGRMLDWLAGCPGATWGQRWQASGVETTSEDWFVHAGFTRPALRADIRYAINALLVLRVVHPGHRWMLRAKRQRLWSDFFAYHDTDTFHRVRELTETAATQSGSSKLTWRVTSHLAQLSIVTGRGLRELTGEDFVVARRAMIDHGLTGHSVPVSWNFARRAGLLIGQPDHMLQVLTAPPRTPTELVDRYPVSDPRIRGLFIDYLTEKAVTTDYSTLAALGMHLVNHFWIDLQTHNPGIDSLRLDPGQAAAWRARVAVLANGHPRTDWVQIVGKVRSFYRDLSAWAHDDPARWAAWVVPNPINPRATGVAQRRNRDRTIARMQQRTRTLAPLVGQLVASAAAHLRLAEQLLDSAQSVAPGAPFQFQDSVWHRPPPGRDPQQRPAHLFAVDPAGARVNLTRSEDEAFWAWAAIEVLRHSGVRVEEMLELSHLSIRPFRKPTGEVVPLLQIAPSKTDTERILPASPALAHALSRIIARHTHAAGAVPVTVRRDPTQRSFSPPLPYLFTRITVTGRVDVLSDRTIRDYLTHAAERAGLRDSDGAPLRFTPHDFRRLFLTDLVASGFPLHIAAQLAGHADLNTTRGYAAIYPVEVFDHYDKFLARRRAERPTAEYRQPTRQELEAFAEHFGRRRVELGDCVRPYDSGCTHEHACLRCEFLQVHPDAHNRLDTIETDLNLRIADATANTWLGDVEQLRITLGRLGDKRAQLPPLANSPADSDDLLAAHPIFSVPS